MAGPQFDELKLQVSLVDNASAQLKLIKSQLDELGTGQQAGNLERLRRQTSEADETIRKLIETVGKGPKAFLDLARNVTIAGVSLGTFGLAAEKTLRTIDDLSKSLVGLLHLSRQTGFDPAAIKQITEAYERSGLSARQAQQEMAGFSESLADFAQTSSRVRNEISAGFANDQQALAIIRQMFDAIDRAPNTIEKFNTIRNQANEIFEYFRGRGQESLGRIIRQKVLEQFRIPGALNVEEDIKPVSDAMSKHLAKQIEAAEKYERITKSIGQNWDKIRDAMTFNMMDSPLMTGLKWLDDFMEKWKKYAETKRPPAAEQRRQEREIRRQREQQRFPERFRGAPTGEAPPAGGTAPRIPAPSVGQYSLLGGGGGGGDVGGGGGGTSARGIPAIGDLLRAGPPIAVPQGDFAGTGWRGLPMSRNIVDQRQERGNDLLETQTGQTRTLISEMKRLNALLSGEEKPGGEKVGFLSMPGGGRTGIGGGIGPGGGGPPGGGLPSGPGGGTTPGGTSPATGQQQPPSVHPMMRVPTSPQEALEQIPPEGLPKPPPTPVLPAPGAGGGPLATIPGPAGLPMPPWGEYVTGPKGFGGGAGGGLAGGVPGLPGGPSGPAAAPRFAPSMTSDDLRRAVLGEGPAAVQMAPSGGAPAPGGGVPPAGGAGVSDKLLDAIQKQEGYFPGSLSQRNNNPGNLKWGPFAKSMGATGPSAGGHAVFPSYEAGRAALKRLIETKGAGKSLAEISQWYAEGPQGGMRWARSVARIAGVDTRFVPSPATPSVDRPTSPAAPGTAPPTVSAPGAGTPGTAPGLGPAAALAYARQHLGEDEIRDQAKLKSWFASQGIHVNPATTTWCAAAVNASLAQAGIRGTGSLAAGSFLRDPRFKPITADQIQPGDIGVVRGRSPRTGIEGSHVGQLTGETRINPRTGELEVKMIAGNEPGTVSGRGGEIERWRSARSLHLLRTPAPDMPTRVAGPSMTTPTSTQQQQPDDTRARLRDQLKLLENREIERKASSFDLKAARSNLDRIMGPKKVEGSGEIRVNVRHGPRTRKASVLKQVPLSRFSQGAKADPGPPEPKAATGESHDAALDS